MEVTQSSKTVFFNTFIIIAAKITNFIDLNSTLPEIQQAISNCTFVSIDCEFTGLKTALNYINAFDTPKQYYEKVIKDCREFLVIQYGITLFR